MKIYSHLMTYLYCSSEPEVQFVDHYIYLGTTMVQKKSAKEIQGGDTGEGFQEHGMLGERRRNRRG